MKANSELNRCAHDYLSKYDQYERAFALYDIDVNKLEQHAARYEREVFKQNSNKLIVEYKEALVESNDNKYVLAYQIVSDFKKHYPNILAHQLNTKELNQLSCEAITAYVVNKHNDDKFRIATPASKANEVIAANINSNKHIDSIATEEQELNKFLNTYLEFNIEKQYFNSQKLKYWTRDKELYTQNLNKSIEITKKIEKLCVDNLPENSNMRNLLKDKAGKLSPFDRPAYENGLVSAYDRLQKNQLTETDYKASIKQVKTIIFKHTEKLKLSSNQNRGYEILII